MTIRISVCAFLVAASLVAADPVATKLARQAEKARNAGQTVRAYLLYAEAAVRDPHTPAYAANRDALASAAKLLSQAEVQNADVSGEVQTLASESEKHEGPPVELATLKEWEQQDRIGPLPHLQFSARSATFDLKADERTLFQQVAAAYGNFRVTFDPQLEPKQPIRFQIDNADFETAMEALTTATNTFIFPVSEKHLFVARDTEEKRNQLEPQTLLTFPLPNALDQKDLIEAANAVRGVMNMRAVGWDSVNRTVMIRDRMTRARVAYSLLEAVLLPKAQVSFEVQILTLDTERNYHYGLSLPTSFQVVDFGQLSGFQRILPSISSTAKFLAFGGGSTLFGIGLGDATLFATSTNSSTRNIYDATVVVASGQTANFHIGSQYPIPQSLYTGFAQGSASIYNPVPQISFVDLGVVLKLTPRVSGDGTIGIIVEAEYKTLGTQTVNTIPAVNQRVLKSTVSVRTGEWAVLAGLDAQSTNNSRNGLAGLAQIPGLNQILSENTRDTQDSHTLIVIKPTITRLPMSDAISPQYLVGPVRGQRVLL